MNRKLRIGVLVRKFPNIVQTYVLSHILSLQDAGHETRIIAELDPQLDEVHPDVARRRLLDDTIYIKVDRTNLLRELTALPLLDAAYIGRALRCLLSPALSGAGAGYRLMSALHARVLQRGGFDILHSHSMFNSYQYLFLRRVFDIPLVTTFHGLVPNNVEMISADKTTAVLHHSDAVLCNTRFAEAQLLELGCPQQKIHIIPQSTDTGRFVFSERAIEARERIIMLSVGRLSIEKGFHIAISAIARLQQSLPQVEYRIIGRGLEEDALRERIRELGVERQVVLLGAVSTEELQRHYSQAHIFVLPSIDLRDGSHTETQGVVLQEAQSSGLPVVASRTGGIPEVIRDGDTGLLFDEGDDAQLAAHIERLAGDPGFYAGICRNARRDVEENYSIDAIYRRLAEVYYEVISHQEETDADIP